MQSGKHNQPHNPYASAAGAYGNNAQKHSADPRELEARVLLKSAQRMTDLQNGWDSRAKNALNETLKYNRDIWMMFYDTAVENKEEGRPDQLRNNIYSLANFVFKREVDILARPESKKLDILIKINRDIAAGLLNGAKSAATEQSGAAKDQQTEKASSGNWESSA